MSLFKVAMVIMIFTSSTLIAEKWNINLGAGVCQSTASGTITSTLNDTLYIQDNLANDTSSYYGYLYMSLKHPLPILPNIRFEYTEYTATGTSTDVGITSSSFPTGSTTSSNTFKSNLSMKQYDTILFYNLLDKNNGITLDLGLDLKYLLSDYTIDSIAESSDSSLIPMVYIRGRVDIPGIDVGFESDAKYITDGSSTVYDLRVKVDYTMTFIPIVHPGIELGYRVEQFTSVGDKNSLIGPILANATDTDIGFSGLYGGVNIKF